MKFYNTLKTMMARWHSLLSIGYLIGLLLWFGLWLLPGGDRFWWMTVFNSHPHYLLIPAPLLVMLAALCRPRLLLPLILVPLALFVTFFWPYYVPRQARAKVVPDLRVMTYNILYSNTDAAAVAQVIRTYHPDLVALQEVQPAQMSALQQQLADEYPHSQLGVVHPFGTTAIFSRYPFLRVEVVDLEVDRPAVVAQVQIKGRAITFAAAHLQAYGWQWIPYVQLPAFIEQRTRGQNRQAQILLDAVLTVDPKAVIILGCDCNSKETGSSYRILNRWLTNAARVVGWSIGATPAAGATADRDLLHIDYLFYRGALTTSGVYKILASGGSDHLPVLGDFYFAE